MHFWFSNIRIYDNQLNYIYIIYIINTLNEVHISYILLHVADFIHNAYEQYM